MKDREPPATFERAPYLYCRHRYRPQAQAVGTEAVAAVVVSAGAHRAQGIHIDFWGNFYPKITSHCLEWNQNDQKTMRYI